MSLTAADLFTPAPSGVGPFGQVPAGLPPSGSWLAIMLQVATRVQLPTTSWQPGAPELTILAIEAVTFSKSDVDISVMAQGGFLQTAASGTVTFVANDGTNVTIAVTPDPSNPAQNPTGAPGWLDLLAQDVYDVTRLQASYAAGPLAIVNLKPTTVGPYVAGGYHVGNAVSGASYKNEATLSIPSSIIAGSGGVVASVTPGLSFTVITTAAPHGLAPGAVVYLVIPVSTGISGLAGVFALVTSASGSTLQVSVSSSGAYVSGGNVYLCTQAPMVADVAGIGSNAGPGTVTVAITQNTGVFVDNVVGWSGSNWESNTALADRCVLSLAIRSPNGPSQAYVYYADTAQQILSSGVLPGNGGTIPVYVLTNGPVSSTEFANPVTGIVSTVVASATPASSTLGDNVTPGVSGLLVTGVTNANPAVITTAGATTLAPGQSMTATISGILGTGGLAGTFLATYVSANSFSVPVDTTSTGAYTGGGSVEGGDLGQIDQLIQQNVVPDGTVAVTVSALALPVSIVASVAVPQANVAAYTVAVQAQLAAQFASYEVGGNAPSFEVAYDDIVGALEEAGVLALGQASYVRQVVSLSLNGGGVGVGVPFPTPYYKAILASANISVLGV